MRRAYILLLFVLLSIALVNLSSIPSLSLSTVTARAGAGATYGFPIGVFEDSNMLGGDRDRFAQMLDDLTRHGLDSVMFTNNSIAGDAPLLDVSDAWGVPVWMLPADDWNEIWWPDSVPATAARARQVAAPAVEAFAGHPSFGGYIVRDEPGLANTDKVALLADALRDLDPDHPTTAILIGLDRVGPIFAAAGLDLLLIDVYPVAYASQPCDFTMNGYGYPWHDFVSYIRAVAGDRPASASLWVILQTHSFGTQLREPLPSEVRMQQWLALGEGAHGIFWFIYGSQQGWRGLADNPALYAEVADLAGRLGPLRPTLLGTAKGPDQFSINGAGQPYVSTLVDAGGERAYVVAVNRDCQQGQALTIRSAGHDGDLRDLESGQVFRQGEPIDFRPGDGRIFELVRRLFLPAIIAR